MNAVIANITLIILILLVYRQIKVWRTRVLLSPGFYFGALWILGVSGSILFFNLELLPATFPQYIDELNIYVGFSALCFFLITPVGRSKINTESIDLNFTSEKVFKILSVLMLIAAIYEFARTGFNINMGAARQSAHESVAARPSWVNYLATTAAPISIWAGFRIMKQLLLKNKFAIADIVFLGMPLIANLIFSITVGGRVDFVYGFVNYLIGMSFAIPISRSLKEVRKPLTLITISLIGVFMFITAVSQQRTENSTGEMSETQDAFEEVAPSVSFLYGPVVYMTESYIGYQYRRDDAVDLKHLGYGRYTFNGFINWKIPFSSALGFTGGSIAHALGIYYSNQETYDFERDYYDIVNTGYIPIVKDFGIVGAFGCILFLVVVAHMLFVKIQQRRSISYATPLFAFMLFLVYWLKMNYYGTLSSPVLNALYGYLIVDLFNYLINPLVLKKR